MALQGRTAYFAVALACTLAVQLGLPAYGTPQSPVWNRRLVQIDLPPSPPPTDPFFPSPPPPPPQECGDLGIQADCANCNANCFSPPELGGCPGTTVPNCQFVGVVCCTAVQLPNACPESGVVCTNSPDPIPPPPPPPTSPPPPPRTSPPPPPTPSPTTGPPPPTPTPPPPSTITS
eukprot:jgi/Botrbrau1/20845/Bobra.0156s0070.1